jgi:hypothetical protein
MTEHNVIIVVLRQPDQSNKYEMRPDPFWEFGSFGCTRCHKSNLMNPRKSESLIGARLAFAQGGPDGFRLVHLTPPIKIISHGDFVEAKWSPENRAIRYNQAPVLIKNDGQSDFPKLRDMIANAKCRSWEAKFASKFRSRRKPIEKNDAEEIMRVFDQRVMSGSPDLFVSSYTDALPKPPPLIDNNRRQTYLVFLGKLPESDCA